MELDEQVGRSTGRLGYTGSTTAHAIGGMASEGCKNGNMGCVYDSLGKFDNALEIHEKDLEIKIKTVGLRHESVARTKFNIGLVYLQLGNLSQARLQFENAHTIFVQSLGPDHPNTKWAARELEQITDNALVQANL